MYAETILFRSVDVALTVAGVTEIFRIEVFTYLKRSFLSSSKSCFDFLDALRDQSTHCIISIPCIERYGSETSAPD